jgi:arylformamidase
MPEDSSASSSITFGSHTGTHIDAPAHVMEGGLSIDKIPLENFVGLCRVFDFSEESGEAITKQMLKGKLEKIFLSASGGKKGERILLKTKNSLWGFKEFYEDYVYLDGDAAEYLAGLDVLLVGIDALSIKKRGGKDNRPHTALLSKNIPIVEGLNLSSVAEGEYELFCLPLNFTGIDGASARAILIEK